MTSYILRRLVLIIPTLLAILLVNFAIVQAAPGGPVEQAVARLQGIGGGAPGARVETVQGESRATRGLDPKLIEEIKRQYGFDKRPATSLVDARPVRQARLWQQLLSRRQGH
jgi:microcin C transport system permease protein